ncbi:MAG: hypothetical protein ACKVTZ_10320, partial [Bacteroidia bacterium]
MNIQSGLTSSTPTWIRNVNDTVFFQANFSGGQELWSSNNLLEFSLGKFTSQIYAGSSGSLPEHIAQLGQKAYFFANDDYSPGNRQRVLYVSDRTNAGTDSDRNIFPGNSSQGRYLTRAGNKLFFSAQSSVSNEELWQSDGTYTGTTQYPDLNTNARGSFPENLTEVIIGGEAYLFFTADDSPTSAAGTAGGNRELWCVRVSSGTPTKFEINATTVGSNPKYLTSFNNACYFIANDGTGDKLYQCNGTTFSVISLGSATINSGGTAPDYILNNPPNYLTRRMAVSGGKLFFSATLSGDEELWVYDGTNPAGRVKDINTAGSSIPGNFTNMNGILYFSAIGASGRELYRSDGTDAGTYLVADLRAGTNSSNPTWLTDVNGILYFFADNPTNTARKNLWFHNPNTCIPTAEQTKIFYSFQTNSGATNTQTTVQASWQITEVSDDFYFSADGNNGAGLEPWYVQECPKPTVNYGTNNVICDDGSTSSPTVSFTQSFAPANICPSGNCFTTTNAALIINPATGVVDLANTPSGIYPVTYRYNGLVPAIGTGSYAGNCDVYFCFNLEIQSNTVSTFIVETVAGNGNQGCTDGGLLTSEFRFGSLTSDAGSATSDANTSLAFSPDGTKLYIAEEHNHIIRQLDLTTNLTSVLAGACNIQGYADDNNNDGSGSNARFRFPTGITVDAFGIIYVADKGNDVIRKIDPTTRNVITIAGVPGTLNGDDVDNANPLLAQFSRPSDVAVDKNGNIYVSDNNNHKIRKIATNGTVSTFAGAASTESIKQGFVDGNGTTARFNYPSGIDIDLNGNLYVADRLNHRIRRITSSGDVSTFAGGGSTGAIAKQDVNGNALTTARFWYPTDVNVTPSNQVLVADRSNSKIKIIEGGVVSNYAGDGIKGYTDGAALNARFNYPVGITTDAAGNAYIIDRPTSTLPSNQRVRKTRINNPAGDITGSNVVCSGINSGSLTLINFPGSPVTTRIARWESSTNGGTTWTSIGNANSATFTFNNLTQTTTYRAIITDAICGETASNTAKIEANIVPIPTVSSIPVCGTSPASNVNITLVAAGSFDGDFVWYDENNVIVPNQNNDTLIVTTSTTKIYSVSIKKGTCESPRVNINVTVISAPA